MPDTTRFPMQIYVVVVDEATGQLVQQGLDELAILVSRLMQHPACASHAQCTLHAVLFLCLLGCAGCSRRRSCYAAAAAAGAFAAMLQASSPAACSIHMLGSLLACKADVCIHLPAPPATDLHHRRPQVRHRGRWGGCAGALRAAVQQAGAAAAGTWPLRQVRAGFGWGCFHAGALRKQGGCTLPSGFAHNLHPLGECAGTAVLPLPPCHASAVPALALPPAHHAVLHACAHSLMSINTCPSALLKMRCSYTDSKRVLVPMIHGQALLPDLKITGAHLWLLILAVWVVVQRLLHARQPHVLPAGSPPCMLPCLLSHPLPFPPSDSSEALLTGRAPPFRLAVRAVHRSGEPFEGVQYALSEPFVVATARVKGAAKLEIPHVDDHVSKIDCVGLQVRVQGATGSALASLAGTAQSAGPASCLGRFRICC